jgi:hypothetical protein
VMLCWRGVSGSVRVGFIVSAATVVLGLTGCSVASVGSVVDRVLGSGVESSVTVDTVGVTTGCALKTGFVDGVVSESVRLQYTYCVYSEGVIPVGTIVDSAVFEALERDGQVKVLFVMKTDMREFPAIADKMFPFGGDIFDVDSNIIMEMVKLRLVDSVLFNNMYSGFSVEQQGDIVMDEGLMGQSYFSAVVGDVGLSALVDSGEVFHIMVFPEVLSGM